MNDDIDTRKCDGFDSDGFPMRESPWAAHQSTCQKCDRRCPIDMRMIETLTKTIEELRKELSEKK